MLRLVLLAALVLCWDGVPARAQNAPAQSTSQPSALMQRADVPAESRHAAYDARRADEQAQALKREAVDLGRELFMLEEELLFPASTQLAVFLSMDVGEFFELESVSLHLDRKEVAHHLYSPREAEALLKGGVQRLYLGNLRTGGHELVALFTGKGPHGRDYRRGATVRFDKALGAKYLELRITDRQRRVQPEFEIKEWE